MTEPVRRSSRAVLVHGLGRTPMSLARLARQLRAAGHVAESVGYVAALESLEQIRDRVRARLLSASRRGLPYAVIGHSLGGLLARLALVDWPSSARPPKLLITLGTPTRPPRLARRLQHAWWYRAGAGDPGQRLADPLVFRAAGRLPTKCIAVVGTAGWRGVVSPFGDDLNDGLVAVDEAVPADPWQLVQVPALHTFLMNAAPVRSLICRELA